MGVYIGLAESLTVRSRRSREWKTLQMRRNFQLTNPWNSMCNSSFIYRSAKRGAPGACCGNIFETQWDENKCGFCKREPHQYRLKRLRRDPFTVSDLTITRIVLIGWLSLPR